MPEIFTAEIELEPNLDTKKLGTLSLESHKSYHNLMPLAEVSARSGAKHYPCLNLCARIPKPGITFSKLLGHKIYALLP